MTKGKVNKTVSFLPSLRVAPLIPRMEIERMENTIELCHFRSIGYPVKILIRCKYQVDRRAIEVREPRTILVMDEEDFGKFFPHILTLLVFSKLLDETSGKVLQYSNFNAKVPKIVKQHYATPSLSYKKPYVVFINRFGIWETRRSLAGQFRIVEAYEKALEKDETSK